MNGEAILDSIPDPVLAVGPLAELLYANRAAEERFGMRMVDHLGEVQLGRVHRDDLITAVSSLASVVNRRVGTLIEIRLQDRSGEFAPFEVRGRAWEHGPEGSIVMVLRETTQRRRWELAAGDASTLGVVIDHLPVAALILDRDGTVRSANRALSRFVHRPLEQLLRTTLASSFAVDDREGVAAEIAAAVGRTTPEPFEARLLDGDDGERHVRVTIVDLSDDRSVQGLIVTIADISSLVDARHRLEWLASHDSLTGLLDRASFLDLLRDAGAHDAGETPHVLLFCDVDDLKSINDEHGHRGGDVVLTTVADRLRLGLRPTDQVGRLSGDEFAVLLVGAGRGTAAVIQDRIERLMIDLIALPDGGYVQVGLSIGSTQVRPGVSAEDLLDAADSEMYETKRARRIA